MRITGFALAFMLCGFAAAQPEVRVRLFSNKTVSSAHIRIMDGHYVWLALTADGRVIDTIADESDRFARLHHIVPRDGELRITRNNRYLGQYARLLLVPRGDSSHYLIRGTGPERVYEGALEIRVEHEKLKLIGIVPLPSYVAGVVESEGGHSPQYEYYKAQAVLARTWLIRNWNKHNSEGYYVTDDVTSQAYYSMAYLQYSDLIRKAVAETGDTVLLDSLGSPVLGAYHSNSGGFTSNSEDVWTQRLDYLRSVPDSFSLAGSNFRWEKRVNKTEFLEYIARKVGASTGDRKFRTAVLDFSPRGREAWFEFGGRRMKWSEARARFNLRSAWFTVRDDGTEVVLSGFGFGHGVGMSQEGAMVMAERGYCYDDILHFYFRDTRLESMNLVGWQGVKSGE